MQLHWERANTKWTPQAFWHRLWVLAESMIIGAGGLFESRYSRLTSQVEELKL
jgi:hypothetical protein